MQVKNAALSWLAAEVTKHIYDILYDDSLVQLVLKALPLFFQQWTHALLQMCHAAS